MNTLLAWTPFVDPIAFDRYWYLLLIPMSLFIAIGYKSVRTVDMSQYWKQVALFTVQLVVAITAIGVATYVLVGHLLPMFAPMPK